MKHFGDITKINGAEVPSVDVICGGSPCQDLSVAGKRAGLAGQRSGLFMEQIRIVKEMRDNERANKGADEHIRSGRFLVWENVPGAFSSPGGDHKGEDFQAVLTEIVRIAKADAPDVPLPDKGKWPHAGCLMGIGDNGQPFSVAYRLHDAQFWGVPQRRKRIALVADFGGPTAPDILFEKVLAVEQGLSGDIEESRKEGQRVAADTEGSVDKTICFEPRSQDGVPRISKGGKSPTLNTAQGGQRQPCVLQNQAISFQERAGKPGGGKGILIQNERTGALSTLNNQSVCYGIGAYNSEGMKSSNPHSGIYEADTSRTLDNNGGNPACNQGGMMVVCATTEMTPKTDEDGVCFSLRSRDYKDPQIVCIEGNGSRPSHQGDGYAESETMYTLNSTEHHAVAYKKDSHAKSAEDGQGWVETEVNDTLNVFDNGETRTPTIILENHPADSRVKISEDGIVQTLNSKMGTGGGNVPMVMEQPIYTIGHDIRSAKFTDDEITDPLTAADYKDPIKINDCRGTYQDKTGTLNPGAHPGSYNGQDAYNDMFIANQSIVRRLTPLECERLQGFPMVDGKGWTDIGEWTDSKGKKRQCTDGNRYKALGNSIALPFWQWMAKRMVNVLKAEGVENPTMASLFSGIGGFELVYARAGAKLVWNSEIESFPEAVTRVHFGDDDTGEVGDYEKYL